MKECLSTAVSFRDKLLRAKSIIGQSSGDILQQDRSSGMHYSLLQGVVGERLNTKSEIYSSDKSDGGGILFYIPLPLSHTWTRHEVIGSINNSKKSTKYFLYNYNNTIPPKVIINIFINCHRTPPQGPLQESPILSRTLRVQLTSAMHRYITLLTPSTLTINRITSYRLLEYIYFITTASTL